MKTLTVLGLLFVSQNSMAAPRCYLAQDFPTLSHLGDLKPGRDANIQTLTVGNITATVNLDGATGYIDSMEIDDNSTGVESSMDSGWDANSTASTIYLQQRPSIYKLVCGPTSGV